MGIVVNLKCGHNGVGGIFNPICLFFLQKKRKTQGEDGHVMQKAESRVTQLQAKDCQLASEAGKDKE